MLVNCAAFNTVQYGNDPCARYLRPKGAIQHQPRATPWEMRPRFHQALKGRFKPEHEVEMKPREGLWHGFGAPFQVLKVFPIETTHVSTSCTLKTPFAVASS